MFTHTAGHNSIGRSLYIGTYSGSNSSYALSGTGQLATIADQYVGSAGTGTLTQTAGTNAIGNNLVLGQYSESSGTYELSRHR